MKASDSLPKTGGRRFLLAAISVLLGSLLAAMAGEAFFRGAGLKAPDLGRFFRISNGADLQFPGRAGHTVIDLYRSNPRGSFPIDLRDAATRQRLLRDRFTRVDEAMATNPYGVEFVYDSRGFRDREFAPRIRGVQRIVFVGDSFTEGQGVVESATAARQVETILRRRERVEVWNLGVRDQDFPRLIARLEAALELDPDAIIYAMVLNDADRDRGLARNWPRINDWITVHKPAASWLEAHSYLVGFVADRYQRFRVSRDTIAWYRALYSEANYEGWKRTRAALQAFRAECQRRGIRFGVTLWPLLIGLEPGATYPFEAAHAQIERGVERAGIPFLDLLPTLRGRDSASLWVHTNDLHPNERAQALVAPVLADFTRLRLLEAAEVRLVAK